MLKKHPTTGTFEPGHGYTLADWNEVSDNPEWTDKELAQAKPFAEAFPELMESIKRARMADVLDKAAG